MKALERLRGMGQSIWLDNFTRAIVDDVVLRHYIDEMSVTGLTSNPAIFGHAIRNTDFYDDAIRALGHSPRSNEDVSVELAVRDATHAADLLRPIHEATAGVDGWVSLDVPPPLSIDAHETLGRAIRLHEMANR